MTLISLTAVAKDRDRDDCTCSLAMIAGSWGYTETGMVVIFNPSLPAPTPIELLPYASVGSYTIDRQGNLSGKRTNARSLQSHQTAIIRGTATVNPDCTGTLNVSFYDPTTDDPTKTPNPGFQGSTTKLVVYVNNATEARMIIPIRPSGLPTRPFVEV